MKKIKYYLLGVNIVALLLMSAGCREYTTKTKINADGSCERTITYKAYSSSSAQNSYFYLPQDKSWHIKLEKNKEGDSVLIAKKYFTDATKLNEEYNARSKVKTNFALRKRFAWFYTYFDYRETYKATNPFDKIKLESFLTKEEYEKYLMNDTSKTLQYRLEQFIFQNENREYYDALLAFAESKNDPALTKIDIENAEKKRKFGSWIDDRGKREGPIWEFLDKQILKKYEKEFTDIVNRVNNKHKAIVSDGITNEVVMPGIILGTNSKSIVGNKVAWKFDGYNFLAKDFVMSVESRVGNIWAFVVTGVLFVVAFLLLIIPKIRKK